MCVLRRLLVSVCVLAVGFCAHRFAVFSWHGFFGCGRGIVVVFRCVVSPLKPVFNGWFFGHFVRVYCVA